MQTVTTRAELQSALTGARAQGRRIALVPTMGALHDGHAALFDVARDKADVVVVSIFVNPLQFGAGEDLAAYPRTLAPDLEVCDVHGVDLVFTPDVATVYPAGESSVTVDPGPLGQQLEGAVRPTHFRGVLTVVTKLFGLVGPDLAVFGVKDYQQLTLIRQCVVDLCLDVEIVGVETIRDRDGLALSSRNRYLDAHERTLALSLSRALRAGAARGADGPEAVAAASREVLDASAEVRLDYLELRAPDLSPVTQSGPARLLVAARVGPARLIDNIAVELASGPPHPDSTDGTVSTHRTTATT